jgi:hypothetical protein
MVRKISRIKKILGVHARSKNLAYLLQPLGPDKVSVQLSNSVNLVPIYTNFCDAPQAFSTVFS